jgi:hypothetical protein
MTFHFQCTKFTMLKILNLKSIGHYHRDWESWDWEDRERSVSELEDKWRVADKGHNWLLIALILVDDESLNLVNSSWINWIWSFWRKNSKFSSILIWYRWNSCNDRDRLIDVLRHSQIQNLYLDQKQCHLQPMFRLHFHCHPPPQIHRAQNHYDTQKIGSHVLEQNIFHINKKSTWTKILWTYLLWTKFTHFTDELWIMVHIFPKFTNFRWTSEL